MCRLSRENKYNFSYYVNKKVDIYFCFEMFPALIYFCDAPGVCVAGEFYNTATSSCVDCPINTYGVDGVVCTPCPNNQVTDSTASTSSADCRCKISSCCCFPSCN